MNVTLWSFIPFLSHPSENIFAWGVAIALLCCKTRKDVLISTVSNYNPRDANYKILMLWHGCLLGHLICDRNGEMLGSCQEIEYISRKCYPIFFVHHSARKDSNWNPARLYKTLTSSFFSSGLKNNYQQHHEVHVCSHSATFWQRVRITSFSVETRSRHHE